MRLLTLVILLLSTDISAFEFSVLLKNQWLDGAYNMCQYQDGTVLNMKFKPCPRKKPLSDAQASSVLLKNQWLDGAYNMCQYQDGTVLNMKFKPCPRKKP